MPRYDIVETRTQFVSAAVQLEDRLLALGSFRDFYAFEEHVRTARGHRGLDVPEQWYQQPVFYFSNHRSMLTHLKRLKYPVQGNWLDFELEIGCVIGTKGVDIAHGYANDFIAGYTIINDWSLRDLQRQEMACGLGPAKGKDFATSLGPQLVTPDELADKRTDKGFDLAMVACINGVEVSRRNWSSIHYSFAQMIERASRGCMLYPGDVIGSGTVGSGCILELTPEAVADKLGRENGWLQPGDMVELEVERLGTLRNGIIAG